MLQPVIMAGGSGTRLWPLSRQLNPKQFLPLANSRTLLQETLARLDGLDHRAPYLICNEQHRFLAAEQVREMGIQSAPLFLEPVGRNTAPAIAIAALHALSFEEDPFLLVMPADHVIQDKAAFQQAIQKGIQLAEKDNLVTFGVKPSTPETGYGYIEKGESLEGLGFQVKCFTEKPDEQTAQTYLEAGQHLWNSGIFLFRASVYLKELMISHATMVTHCQEAYRLSTQDADFIRLEKNQFSTCPADSIDYAVMEKTDKAVVVPLDAAWTDLGSWSALWELRTKDKNANAISGDVVIEKVSNSLIHAEHRLVSAVGVNDLIIVETKDAVLVAHKNHVQDVKKVVEAIKADGRHEHIAHREVYRPWGKYDSIDEGPRYQVKRITVKPGAKLSVQMHYHRAEHWIVVSGTAKVTRGEDTFLVSENESTFIPIGQIHALENPGKVPLELIEVQSGVYLGEDDIVRFEDRYGRVKEKEITGVL